MPPTPIPPALSKEQWAAFVAGDEFAVGRGDKHAEAALCLYNQPFGFTQEDVELLTRHGDQTLDDQDLLRAASLRDRIASLLPPSE